MEDRRIAWDIKGISKAQRRAAALGADVHVAGVSDAFTYGWRAMGG